MAACAPTPHAVAEETAAARPEAAGRKRYRRCGPGETMPDPRPGDIILVRTATLAGRLTRFAERRRYHAAEDRPYAYWNHAALVMNRLGHLIEVRPSGVGLRAIEGYRDLEYHYVHLELDETGQRRAIGYARSCLGQRYGFDSIALLGISALLGDRFRVPDRGQQGCAALITRALQRAGMTFARRPTEMMLADLARHFGVTP